jgi:DNA transposition AAA+ family ATPase
MSDAIELAAMAAGPAGEIDLPAIRATVQAVMGKHRMSTAEAARQSGVGNSTLAAFLLDKYAGNNEQIGHKLKTWLETREARTRVQAMVRPEACFTATPTADAFLAALEHAQFIPDLVVIAGGAGVGKTTAARQYERTHRNVWMLVGEPALASSFAVLERLCEALALRENSPAARSRAVAQRMQGSGGLILVDEAQHLSTQAIEQLRSLHDVAGVGLALVGNEAVYGRIDGGGRRAEFAQLFSRVGMRVRRAKPLARDIEALLDANDVAGEAERRLLKAIGGKPGALRGMVKTLRVARMMAHAAETELAAEHIRAAWSRLSDAAPLDEAA